MAETPASDPVAESLRLYNSGKGAVSRGDLANAEAIFREAVRLDPANARASHYLASIYLQQNRRAEAETVLVNAANKTPLVDSMRMLADIFDTSNRVKQAVVCYETILNALPTDIATLIK